MEKQNLKNIWLWAVIVAVAVFGWWWSQRAAAPADEAALQKELNKVDLGSVEAEMNTTNADVNSL